MGGSTDLARWPRWRSPCCEHTGARPPPRGSPRAPLAAGLLPSQLPDWFLQERPAGGDSRGDSALCPGRPAAGGGGGRRHEGVQPARLAARVPARSRSCLAGLWPRESITSPAPCSGREGPATTSHPEPQGAQAPGAPGLRGRPRTRSFDVDFPSARPLPGQPLRRGCSHPSSRSWAVLKPLADTREPVLATEIILFPLALWMGEGGSQVSLQGQSLLDPRHPCAAAGISSLPPVNP